MARKRARQARPARADLRRKPARARQPKTHRAAGSSGRAGKKRVLLIVFIPGKTQLEGVITGLLDLGLAATALESKGLAAVLREELPIFGTLAEMLPVLEGSRVILSATTRALADRAIECVAAEVGKGAIAFTVPIDRIVETGR